MLNRLVDCRFMPKPFFDGMFRICVQENAAKIVWMFLTIEIRPTNAPIEYCYATRPLQLLDDKVNRNHGVVMAVVQAYYPHKSDMLAALATALNDIVMSIGGFFELFYDHLKRGERFEPTRYFGHMTRVWMHAAGFSRQQADEVLEQCTVELEHIDRISTDVERAFALLLQA